jgi:nucleotidyltransferase/DNA polymerase involved in DNA repair
LPAISSLSHFCIHQTLANNLGRRNYTLERASIDELFIDVTSFCNNPERDQHEKIDDNDNENGVDFASAEKQFRSTCQNNAMQSLQETNICDENNLHPNDINAEKALVLGCHIARIVRRAVFDELRFTLSAGISTSKLVAKLGATYGKPNGQAVIFPGAITKVLTFIN